MKERTTTTNTTHERHPDIALRDWFAGQVLSTVAPIWFRDWCIVLRGSKDEIVGPIVAESCYLMADAMLEARASSTPPEDQSSIAH